MRPRCHITNRSLPIRLRFLLPLALLATGVVAHADTFTITGTNVNISFSLPASPKTQYSTDLTVDPEGFWIDPVTMMVNGQSGSQSINFSPSKLAEGCRSRLPVRAADRIKGPGCCSIREVCNSSPER